MKGPWRFHKKHYRGFFKAMQDYNGSVQEGAFNPSINDGKGGGFLHSPSTSFDSLHAYKLFRP